MISKPLVKKKKLFTRKREKEKRFKPIMMMMKTMISTIEIAENNYLHYKINKIYKEFLSS